MSGCKNPWVLSYGHQNFDCLNAENLGSVSQRAAKLLAVKVGVLKKKSAASAIPLILCAIAFGPGSSWPGVKSFSKFDSQ